MAEAWSGQRSARVLHLLSVACLVLGGSCPRSTNFQRKGSCEFSSGPMSVWMPVNLQVKVLPQGLRSPQPEVILPVPLVARLGLSQPEAGRLALPAPCASGGVPGRRFMGNLIPSAPYTCSPHSGSVPALGPSSDGLSSCYPSLCPLALLSERILPFYL